MQLTKENAHELAKRMSKELDGAILAITVTADYDMESRLDKNGLDNTGWTNEPAKQKQPVKVADTGLMWDTGYYNYFADFEKTQIEFPAPGVVIIQQYTYRGERVFWVFIKQ